MAKKTRASVGRNKVVKASRAQKQMAKKSFEVAKKAGMVKEKRGKGPNLGIAGRKSKQGVQGVRASSHDPSIN